ncbi:hypothetical protein U9M48_044527, partial [Paspalum notatum var. saurae]
WDGTGRRERRGGGEDSAQQQRPPCSQASRAVDYSTPVEKPEAAGEEACRKLRCGESKPSQAAPLLSGSPTLHPHPLSLPLVSLSLLSPTRFCLPPPTKGQPTQGREVRRGEERRGEEREKSRSRVLPHFCSNRRRLAREIRSACAAAAASRDRGVVRPSGIGFHGELLIWIPDPIGAD